jgi:hypothetical protein
MSVFANHDNTDGSQPPTEAHHMPPLDVDDPKPLWEEDSDRAMFLAQDLGTDEDPDDDDPPRHEDAFWQAVEAERQQDLAVFEARAKAEDPLGPLFFNVIAKCRCRETFDSHHYPDCPVYPDESVTPVYNPAWPQDGWTAVPVLNAHATLWVKSS